MPDSDLLKVVVTCPVCDETWDIIKNSIYSSVFVKCMSCKECFEVKDIK